MKYPWIDEYLMAKRGVTKELQAEWNWIRYLHSKGAEATELHEIAL